MKHRLQTLLKHKLQWLALLIALLGVSQEVWSETVSLFSINVRYSSSNHYYNVSRLHTTTCTNPNNWPCNGDNWIASDGSTDLGTVSGTIALSGYIWLDYDNERNNGYVKWKVDDGSFTEKTMSKQSDYKSDWCGKGSKWFRYDTGSTFDIDTRLLPAGTHTIEFYARSPWYNDSEYHGSSSNSYKIKFTTTGPAAPTIIGASGSGWNGKSWEMSESGTNLVSKKVYIPTEACNYQFKIMDGSNYYGWSNCSSSTQAHANIVEGSSGNVKICTSSPSFGAAIATITYNTSTHQIDVELESISSITIQMRNDINWSASNIKLYSWIDDNNKCSGAWSGTVMESAGGTWYKSTPSSCVPLYAIFNSDGSNQSADIELEYPFCYKVYNSSGTKYELIDCPCSKPAASFTTVKAQLNAGGGSPWAGSEATTSSAASDGYFADGHRTITLTETNGSYAYYQWEVSTNNGSSYSDISGASSASSSYTAPLPGTYKFRCKAGCSSSDYSTSGAITVNVPYPSMGIEGPGIKGCAAWTPSYASGSGIMTRSGLTWSGTVTVNATGTTDGAFIIIQQYKNGATSGTGWASCTEDGNACSGTCESDNIKGNTVNKDCKRNTLTNLDKVDGGNYYFNSNKFAADQQVKITVTMTAYNTYTVTACLVPQSLSITGPLQACVNDESLTAMVASVTATSPSYQWQESSDASSWADVSTGSGDKTASYTPAKSVGAKYYRCAVTACGVTENSTHKLYTIYGTSVAGSIAQKTSGATSPLGICKNATATLVLSGNTGSIQWQKYNSSTSKFEDKSGETGSEYTTTAKNATGTDYYRAAVTNGTCATAYTATTTAGAFQVVSYNPVDAGTVALTPNEVCVGEDSQASVTGVELAGGVGDWSAGSGASIDSDGSIETSSSGTPSITYTISSYKCAGTASANATLTVKATPSFSITPASPSGTAWKPVTLSTSPTQTGAEWSITTNHSEAGDATSVGYLSTTSGSGTVFKGPAPASSGSNTFVVQATVTNGSTGCSKTVTKNVSVSYEDCE